MHKTSLQDHVTLTDEHGKTMDVSVIGKPGEPESIYVMIQAGNAMFTFHADADGVEQLGRLLIAAAEHSRAVAVNVAALEAC
jgi:hypothetical protein